MKLVERKDIDENLWNLWCETSVVFSPFSRLSYLDSLAENLLFVLNEDETGGLALPYNHRLGVKTLYTPVFCRWIMWLGEGKPEPSELTAFVCQHFKQAEIYTQNEIFKGEKVSLIYQTVRKEDYALNSQVKRKLKKTEKEDWLISWNEPLDKALNLIESSLKNKFVSLEDSSFPKLNKLAFHMNEAGLLRIISLMNKKGELLGSLLLISDKNSCLYLKGACIESVKLAGGMYYLMNEALKFAFDKDLEFDFGGSRIPGVRKFNLSFGSSDHAYYSFSWDKGPFWYSVLKVIRRKLRNR